MICPCQRQQATPCDYDQCCAPLHNGLPAPNAQALMQSRFSAYVLGLTRYINDTWHPSTRPSQLTLTADNSWLKLDIISAHEHKVHFCAYFKDENGFAVLEETSDFIFENTRWFYVNGDTDTRAFKPQRNTPCLCGSGKKFKQCCA